MEIMSDRVFRLRSNPDGHVSGQTIMRFGPSEKPYIGTYAGPGTVAGHVLAAYDDTLQLRMIYQSLNSDSKLVAGKARVSVITDADGSVHMVLDWQWLTGSGSGRSEWVEIFD